VKRRTLSLLAALLVSGTAGAYAQKKSHNKGSAAQSPEATQQASDLFRRLCRGEALVNLRTLSETLSPAAQKQSDEAPKDGPLHTSTYAPLHEIAAAQPSLATPSEELRTKGALHFSAFPAKTYPFVSFVRGADDVPVQLSFKDKNHVQITYLSRTGAKPSCQVTFYANSENFSGAGYRRVDDAWVQVFEALSKDIAPTSSDDNAPATCTCTVYSETLTTVSNSASVACPSPKDKCEPRILYTDTSRASADLWAKCGSAKSKPTGITGVLDNLRYDCHK